MKQLGILLGLLITGNVFANTNSVTDYTLANSVFIESQLELFELEQDLFTSLEIEDSLEVEDIQICEIDETLEFASKDADNTSLAVNDINVIEIEEDVEIGFNTKKYLPQGFNPSEGMPCEKEIVVVSLY